MSIFRSLRNGFEHSYVRRNNIVAFTRNG